MFGTNRKEKEPKESNGNRTHTILIPLINTGIMVVLLGWILSSINKLQRQLAVLEVINPTVLENRITTIEGDVGVLKKDSHRHYRYGDDGESIKIQHF